MYSFENNIIKIFEENAYDFEKKNTISYKIVDEFQVLFDTYFKSTLSPIEMWALVYAVEQTLNYKYHNPCMALMEQIASMKLNNWDYSRLKAVANLVMSHFDFDKLTFLFSIK